VADYSFWVGSTKNVWGTGLMKGFVLLAGLVLFGHCMFKLSSPNTTPSFVFVQY